MSAAEVTVSPFGLTSGTALPNNGAMYGPDTAGTITGGIQEAVNFAVAQALSAGAAAPDVVLLPGKFVLSKFTDSIYHSVINVDAGYSIMDGPPISVTIRGTGYPTNLLDGTTFVNSYPHGCTILDASALDVLSYGLYKQGRVILVPPRAGKIPCNAMLLTVENICMIMPTYMASGTGSPAYSISGLQARLFVAGDTQESNAEHWQFVNGIDAWGASSFKTKNVNVASALTAYNTAGNTHGGGGGVICYGSAAGFVYPTGDNQGNLRAETISAYDLSIGVHFASHFYADQMYVQNCAYAFYTNEGGHAAHISRLNAQQCTIMIRHLLFPQLANSYNGSFFSPVGDLYRILGLGYPPSAQESTFTVSQASLEAIASILTDDPSNPLTVVINADCTGGMPTSAWGAGANLMVNMHDVTENAMPVLTGTTAGTVASSQSGVTPWDKRFVAYLNGYRNATATAQTITFVNTYNHPPAVLKDDTGASTASTKKLTLPASMPSPVTGYIILEGY